MQENDIIDNVLRQICGYDEMLFNIYKTELMKCHKPYTIAKLLDEYFLISKLILTEYNKNKVAGILRDLKKLKSPIIPDIMQCNMDFYDYIHSMPWKQWTVWDIEREYIDVLMCRGETSDFAPSDKFTNRQVTEMLDLLVNCDVIYNFKWIDIADKYENCFSDDEFQDTKKVRVQTI